MRRDTKLESQGAEFLVLANLLIEGVEAHKAYTNTQGHDLTAIGRTGKIARVQVKSRWKTGAEGFILKSVNCDFVVVALLNRGSTDGRRNKLDPEFFVIPSATAKQLPRTQGWGKVSLTKDLRQHLALFRNAWHLIAEYVA